MNTTANVQQGQHSSFTAKCRQNMPKNKELKKKAKSPIQQYHPLANIFWQSRTMRFNKENACHD